MGYTKETLKGLSWIGLFRIASRIISYIRIAILARILTPAQYGTADIALLVLAITEVFTETGINVFLVQQKENIDRYINTAWVVSILRGIIIASVIMLSAPYISVFFNTPDVTDLLFLTAVIALLRGFINPSIVKYIKELNFKSEFYFRTGIVFIEVIVSIVLAYLWQSPSAILYGIIVGTLCEVLLSFILIKPTPRLQFEYSLLKNIVSKGKWLTAAGIFNYLYQNGDNIVIGRILGTSQLGLYQRAYTISMLPITEVADVIGKVTFPVYTKMSEDIKRLQRAYLKTLSRTSVIVFLIGTIFFMFPEFIVRIILGDQWISVAPVLQVLAISGVIRALLLTSIWPFYALGRQDLVTKVIFVSFLGMAVSIVPFTYSWGLIGASYSVLLGSVLSVPLIIYYLKQIFTISK